MAEKLWSTGLVQVEVKWGGSRTEEKSATSAEKVQPMVRVVDMAEEEVVFQRREDSLSERQLKDR